MIAHAREFADGAHEKSSAGNPAISRHNDRNPQGPIDHSLYSSLRCGILSINEGGIIAWCGPVAEAVFGYTTAEMTAQPVWLLIPELRQEILGEYLESFYQIGEQVLIGSPIEMTGRRKDGQSIPLSLSLRRLHFFMWSPLVLLFNDLTQLIQMETELKNFSVEQQYAHQMQEEMAAQLAIQLEEADFSKKQAQTAQMELEQDRADLLFARAELQRKNEELEQTLRELKQTEAELLQADKLASVGQLAAGIAHEINTPIQFVGDNVRACTEMIEDVRRLIDAYRNLANDLEQRGEHGSRLSDIRRIEKEIDIDFIFEDMPEASAQSLDGIERVRTIVQAMKDFAHGGGSDEWSTFDINAAMKTTMTIARNELKYVANVETDFGTLPAMTGNVAELNQVFLNLLINAAHAIHDKGGEVGVITVRTRSHEDWIVVSISDTGCGIPESIRNRIFDPFFTTKEVGRGSGQGLAISRNIIVDRHQGRLDVETTEGVGTTMHVWLPVSPDGKNHSQQSTAAAEN